MHECALFYPEAGGIVANEACMLGKVRVVVRVADPYGFSCGSGSGSSDPYGFHADPDPT